MRRLERKIELLKKLKVDWSSTRSSLPSWIAFLGHPLVCWGCARAHLIGNWDAEAYYGLHLQGTSRSSTLVTLEIVILSSSMSILGEGLIFCCQLLVPIFVKVKVAILIARFSIYSCTFWWKWSNGSCTIQEYECHTLQSVKKAVSIYLRSGLVHDCQSQ